MFSQYEFQYWFTKIGCMFQEEFGDAKLDVSFVDHQCKKYGLLKFDVDAAFSATKTLRIA